MSNGMLAKFVGQTVRQDGRYRGEVQGYNEETDTLTLRYISELDETYEEELEHLLNQKKIKLLKSPIKGSQIRLFLYIMQSSSKHFIYKYIDNCCIEHVCSDQQIGSQRIDR